MSITTTSSYNSATSLDTENDDSYEVDSIDKKLEDLMGEEFAYPDPDDQEFQNKIYSKREFYYHKIPGRSHLKTYDDVKKYRDNTCNRKFALQEHQSFLANFINPDTPYKGVLIFHGTGTGKSCAGISIAERFKPMIQKYGTKIYILTSGPLIKESWKRELLKCTGETYKKKQDASIHMTDAEEKRTDNAAINIAMQYYRFISYKSFHKKVLGEKIREEVKTDDDKTKRIHKKTKEGKYERDISIDRIDRLDNTLIIVDEAHNLTKNSRGEALKKIIDNSNNLKVVLLSATPMKNLADDIIELINFLRPKNAPIERDRIFNSYTNYQMNFKSGGIDYLKKMATGYISYLRGADPLTFAKRDERGEVPEQLLFTKLVRCKMLPFQKSIYMKVFREAEDSLDKTSEAVANFAFPALADDRKSIIGTWSKAGIDNLKNQLKTDYDLLNKKIATDILKEKDTSSEEDIIRVSNNGKTISGRILKMTNLKHFSIKFYKALKKINRLIWGKKGASTAFIYSNLVKVGVEIYSEILLQNGYLEYEEEYQNYKIQSDTKCYYCGFTHKQHQEKDLRERTMKRQNNNISESSTEYQKKKGEPPSHKFHPATFVAVTGKSTDDAMEVIPEDKQRILDKVFSHIDNREGKFIKFVLGSPVMTEGISLRNVAEVHILDVYYNLGKIDQIIGRAIRHCSHYALISDTNKNPNVKVYKYVVQLDDETKLSGEEDLYRKAELKYMLVKKVERALKEVAVDCPLNRHGNIFPEELEEFKNCVELSKDMKKSNDVVLCPARCDYTKCEFKCENKKLNQLHWDEKTKTYKNIIKDKLDYTTFTQTLARSEIENVKSLIKDMYRIEYVYSLQDILGFVKNSYEGEKKDLFDNFFAFKALDELVPVSENEFNNFKDTIFDKYNRSGYLIYINKYYIFQPFNENEDVPMYYRSTYNKSMNKQLSIYNYLKNTLKYKQFEGAKDTQIKDTINQKIDKYDFESTMDYYENRNEFKFVGIIDKESSRNKNKTYDELKDVFKLREKRSKLLDKKRGTGIQSFKGAVCDISYPKDYLENVAKELKINLKGSEARLEVCSVIKNRLLFLEKYGTSNNKNKLTYMMIPANHNTYEFPYNIEDRYLDTINKIKDKIKFKVDISTKQDTQIIGKETTVPMFTVTLKHTNNLDEFKSFLKSIGGDFSSSKNLWSFIYK